MVLISKQRLLEAAGWSLGGDASRDSANMLAAKKW